MYPYLLRLYKLSRYSMFIANRFTDFIIQIDVEQIISYFVEELGYSI